MNQVPSNEAMQIRRARADDETAIVTMVRLSRLFRPDEQDFLRDVISRFFRAPGRQSHWLVLERDGVAGATFFQPETMAPDVWNLRFMCVMPECRSQGGGSALLGAVESAIELRGARMLIAEVPGDEHFAASRRFYLNNGYAEEARIRDFYHPGADRVLYRKTFASQG